MTQTLIESPENTILDRVRLEMQHRNLPQNAVAKAAGISAPALTQLLNGSYNANPQAQLEKLERWLAKEAAQQAAPVILPEPNWVSTPTAERVVAALMQAHKYRKTSVIYGGAGLGKTTAAEEYQRRYPNVWIATARPSCASVTAILEEVCFAIGIKNPPGSARRMYREILRRIESSGGLLIIDEAQHLSVQALDELRSLYDTGMIGLALIGNEILYTSMTGGNRAPHLDRLFSRIGKRLSLRRPQKSDVLNLAIEMGVPADDTAAMKFLCEIGSKAGALRVVVLTVQQASLKAAGEPIALQHLRAAWEELSL